MLLFFSVETRVEYLFPLLSSVFPFILSIIKYKGFTLIIFKIAKVFSGKIPSVINKDSFV